MGQLSRDILTVSSQIFSRAAAGQGSILSGDNPVNYNTSNPFRLWVIQVVIMVFMTRALWFPLRRMRQPLVISEIIGGIILGPTAMGRIPHFRERIFPSDSIPLLNLTSTIGLVFYIFLVALELDVRMIKQNAMASALVTTTGLIFPFGLGAALGAGIYHEFADPSIKLGNFILFVGVAVGITAFPVLVRILVSLELLHTDVGVICLSAGLGNDIIGWILTALTVALLNASSGLTALWMLFCSMGYILLFQFPIKRAYVWFARRTGSIEQGSPTTATMIVTLLLVLVSAFFTDVIGIHAVFGGFLTGLIIPRESGFAISVAEKLDVIVSGILMPIYFIISGLRTDLSLLNNGIIWGYTILTCVVSFFSKFIPCGAAARLGGFSWREAGAIGSLMSCKGLVELIVLNLGLSAGVLDTRTFSMFVVHALIITFMTTPLVFFFYPPRARKREDVDFKSRVSIVLDRIDQLPAAMMLSQLISSSRSTQAATPAKSTDEEVGINGSSDPPGQSRTSPPYHSPPIHIDALRLIKSTTHTSAAPQEADPLFLDDPVVLTLRTFGILDKLDVSARVSVVDYAEYPDAVARHAQESGSQLVIFPWSRGSASVHESDSQNSAWNPFNGIFHKSSVRVQDQTSAITYSEFIRGVFSKSPSDVALFVDCGFGGKLGPTKHRIFLPFFGGPDDRLALTFLVQLCHNTLVTAKAVRIKTDTTIQVTQTGPAPGTADDDLWKKYTTPSEIHDVALIVALSRISFEDQISTNPLRTAVNLSSEMSTQNPTKTVTILHGHSLQMASESYWEAELKQTVNEAGGFVDSSVRETLGDIGAAVVAKGIHANLLVMQAATVRPS